MSDFVCPYKFDNALPPIPADPKLIDIEFERAAFVRFRYDSAAEAQAKYELLPEPDLGITIDLVDPDAYVAAAPGAPLDPEDAELLSAAAFEKAVGEKRSVSAVAKDMRTQVTFLRKTPLMANNLYDSVYKFQKGNMESKPILATTTALAMASGSKTLAQHLEEIDASFEEADRCRLGSRDLVHPHDKTLTPTSVVPVLPDFAGWDNVYVQMNFDIDPSLANPGDVESAFARERVGRALVKGFKAGEEAYLSYLLPPPKDESDADEEDAEVPLEWVREYAYSVAKKQQHKDGREELQYYLALGPNAASFNQIESKISMSRKQYRTKPNRPSAVTFTRRTLDSAEETELLERRKLLMGNSQLRLTHSTPGPLSSRAAAGEGGGGADGFEVDDDDAEQPLLQEAPAGGVSSSAAAAGEDEDDDDDEDDGMVVDDE